MEEVEVGVKIILT